MGHGKNIVKMESWKKKEKVWQKKYLIKQGQRIFQNGQEPEIQECLRTQV